MTDKQKRPIAIQFKVGLGIGAAILSLLGFGATTQAADDDDPDEVQTVRQYDDEDDDD